MIVFCTKNTAFGGCIGTSFRLSCRIVPHAEVGQLYSGGKEKSRKRAYRRL
jgi:hypothetical protein